MLESGSSAVAVGAGGLGHIGIQCLKAMTPAQVIAVDTSEDALKLALDCGADHVVAADGQQAQQVRDLTGSGADAVFDFVGEDSTIADSVAMLRPGGTYYLVGYGGTVTLPTRSSCWARSPWWGTSSAPTPTWPASSTWPARGRSGFNPPATRWKRAPTRSAISAAAAPPAILVPS